MASKLRYVREDVVQRGIRGDSEPLPYRSRRKAIRGRAEQKPERSLGLGRPAYLSNAIPHGLIWQRRDPRPSAGDIGAIEIVVVGVVS